MKQLRACVIKEARLLLADSHGLLLLFIMPLTFILVMSLALQDAFDARAGRKHAVLLAGAADQAGARILADRLTSTGAYAVRLEPAADVEYLTVLARRGNADFAIKLGAGFARFVQTGDGEPVSVIVAPGVDKRDQAILVGTIRMILASERVNQLLDDIGHRPDGQIAPSIPVIHAYGSDRPRQPSAVQQNVPAWLVFAVFFVATPFANGLVRERQLGTYRRLRTVAISPIVQLGGKLLPYFIVNQVQVVCMLLAGMLLVPLLGGDALEINGEITAMVLLCVCLSCAALGLSLLVAVVVRTTEQATMLSGLGNIILAAIGGVMVPEFIMPESMQQIAQLSPMAWALDAFLDLFLRGGGVADIANQLIKLGLMAAFSVLVAAAVYRYSD